MPLYARIIIFVLAAAVIGRIYVRYPLRIRILVRKTEFSPWKTSSQVKDYLESREWYQEWLECLKKARGHDEVESFSRGEELDSSIVSAFDWAGSPQGYDVWYDRNCDFLLWFRDEPSLSEGSPDGPSAKDGS
ncbi:MAG: hypothetical protein IKN06_00400 [Bacteroidales bacterium]|nr:hypothetical protein [Bacteroidales bacterium]